MKHVKVTILATLIFFFFLNLLPVLFLSMNFKTRSVAIVELGGDLLPRLARERINEEKRAGVSCSNGRTQSGVRRDKY